MKSRKPPFGGFGGRNRHRAQNYQLRKNIKPPLGGVGVEIGTEQRAQGSEHDILKRNVVSLKAAILA